MTELFYDTGIGKEGYSIIGQGQIERILSGKPEERRELFDEAAGIVKYKKRKATARRRLKTSGKIWCVSMIFYRVRAPGRTLERQAQKARVYLKKKEELKTYDVNMFLMEVDRIENQLREVQDKFQIADAELKDANASYESVRSDYEKMEQSMAAMDEQIESLREELNHSTVTKGKLEGQINVLNEQIHSAEMTDEHLQSRLDSIDRDKKEREEAKAGYDAEKAELDQSLAEISQRKNEAEEHQKQLASQIAKCSEGIERGKNEMMELLNKKASIKARQQRFDTMMEQVNIRKAQLTQRLLARKTQEADLESVLEGYQKDLDMVNTQIAESRKRCRDGKPDQRMETQIHRDEPEVRTGCGKVSQGAVAIRVPAQYCGAL